MPAYSTLKDFVEAIKTGKTHITRRFDLFFSPPAAVTGHPDWGKFSTENWSSGPPLWLGAFLDSIGLTPPEINHVLLWPGPELEKARDAAVRAVSGSGVVQGKAPKFFWELSNGLTPQTIERVSSAGIPEIVFLSPRTAVVITHNAATNKDEVEVHDV
jgi:hypothetical protein